MRPRDMPGIQRSLARAASEHVAWRKAHITTNEVSDLLTVTELLRGRLPLADLYLVSQAMRDVALDAARDVPDDVVMGDAMPASHGVIAYVGGLPPLTRGAAPRVISWSSVESGDLLMCAWADSADVPAGDGLADVRAGGWALSGVGMTSRLDPLRWGALGPIQRRLGSLLYATWTAMATPTVAEVRERVDLGATGSKRRRERARPVKVIDLRRLARRPDPEGSGDGTRTYTHQWVVRGHWRQQAHGPAWSLRRTTWVPPYIKGSEGAPFLPSETVFVWRR